MTGWRGRPEALSLASPSPRLPVLSFSRPRVVEGLIGSGKHGRAPPHTAHTADAVTEGPRLDPGRDADVVPRLRDERDHRARPSPGARPAPTGLPARSLQRL